MPAGVWTSTVSPAPWSFTARPTGDWMEIRPRRASILGIPSQLASWLRAYLPLPPISPEARLSGIDHAANRLTLHFAINDFVEKVTPGMLYRLRRRLLPWVG